MDAQDLNEELRSRKQERTEASSLTEPPIASQMAPPAVTRTTATSRRTFLHRGLLAGLSLPVLGAFIAACTGTKTGTKTDTKDTAELGSADGADGAGESGDSDTGNPGAGEGTAVDAGKRTGGTIRVASQTPASPLDPVNMQALGTYGIIAQCFEYLCALGDTDIAPGLAVAWTPNADGSEWTFDLRSGVKWQDGKDFTSADVAATIDRLVEAGNSGLKGVLGKGAVNAKDPAKAVFTLLGPNGNFPYLVSLYNPQSVITPASYATGSTLDSNKNGTGAFKLESFDAATGAKFVRNDSWWGGTTPLDGSEWQFFDDVSGMTAAMVAKEVDAIVEFQTIGGDALLNDPDFVVVAMQSAAHRQLWMRTDRGEFADKRVRQALALSIDRKKIVETLFKGKADIGNDHVIAPIYPYFDASVQQRERDVDKAKALLAEVGKTTVSAVLNVGQLQEIPDLAALIVADAKEAGFDLTVNSESLDSFYATQWCPAEPADPPCSGGADLGIVDYGHRATPDVYLNAAFATSGIWNASQYSSPTFDAAFKEFQQAVTLDAQKVAATKLQTILNDDVPAIVPYFYSYISGHSKAFANVRVSAVGQLFLDRATRV